jgi:flagellar assembly protein FliH
MSPDPAMAVRLGLEVHPFAYTEAVEPADPVSEIASQEASAEDRARGEAAAHQAGQLEGEGRARAAGEQELAAIRESLSTALRGFAREREHYYAQVETEVVGLALSIARKILHREAQVDPLLLAGLVRVALEQMERGTQVVLRICPRQVAEYRSFFAQHMESGQVPAVEEDAALEPDHCRLQTTVGTTELGLEVQLQEIERGLMDLMAERPRVGA